MTTASYVHVRPEENLPALAGAGRFKAVAIIEADVSADWQYKASKWLVASGCRYLMSWGRECGSWDDSVNWAAIELFPGRDQPDRSDDPDFVMTTWHEGVPLEEAFAFCHFCGFDPDVEFDSAVHVHIAESPNADFVVQAFNAATPAWNE